MLAEGNNIMINPAICAEIFNNFFIDVIEDLDIDRTLHIGCMDNSNDPVANAINRYENHPSILRIIQEGYSENTFSFEPISELNILSVFNNINSSKAYQKNNIPPQILKDNVDICTVILSSDINNCIYHSIFPNNLKHADITPTFKKKRTIT